MDAGKRHVQSFPPMRSIFNSHLCVLPFHPGHWQRLWMYLQEGALVGGLMLNTID